MLALELESIRTRITRLSQKQRDDSASQDGAAASSAEVPKEKGSEVHSDAAAASVNNGAASSSAAAPYVTVRIPAGFYPPNPLGDSTPDGNSANATGQNAGPSDR